LNSCAFQESRYRCHHLGCCECRARTWCQQLGQIGISLIFILILLFRPTGLFGAKA
jgi:branched-subunit amino acid ABC-type transport system permease component